MAFNGGAKAYIHSLGEPLHYEFKPLGVYFTVLAVGVTNTAVLEKFGFDPKTMPMKPISVEGAYLRASAVCSKTAPESFQAG
jgi:short-subunit dehydrogenase